MTVYTNEHGTAWYVNIVDLADLPEMLRTTVAEWVDTDREIENLSDRVDSGYVPLVAEDEDQLDARKELLKNGFNGVSRSVKVKASRGGLRGRSTDTATDRGAMPDGK